MTAPDASLRLVEATERPVTALARGLNLVGVAAVAVSLYTGSVGAPSPLLLAIAGVALLSWAVRSLLPIRWMNATLVAELLMLVGGAATAIPTSGLMIAPAFAGIVMLLGRPKRPLPLGLAMGVLGLIILAIVAVLTDAPPLVLVAMLGTFLLAGVIGFSRRQGRLAEAQKNLLLEERLELAQERARATSLTERAAVARDIHDVLAHSLGGLVIQLDAVEALLEAGDATAALSRVSDARELAASGLGDARRAVDALRTAPAPSESRLVSVEELNQTLQELVAAHRSLGGELNFQASGQPHPLSADQTHALSRGLQECLSNARKHAPGQPVDVRLDWLENAVRLRTSAPFASTATDLSLSGGGNGLSGMRERVAALPDGGTVTAGAEGDSFVVVIEVRLQ